MKDVSLIRVIGKKKWNKLLVTKIIFLVRHTTWVKNIVQVRNKSSDITICIDF